MLRPRLGCKGLSELIGGLIILIVIISAFSGILLAIRELSEHERRIVEEIENTKDKEDLEVIYANLTDSVLNISILNSGPYDVFIDKLLVIDLTAGSYTLVEIDVGIGAGEVEEIAPTYSFTQGNNYLLKFITIKGEVLSYRFFSPTSARIEVTCIATPKNITSHELVTVLAFYRNIDSRVDAIYNIEPTISYKTSQGVSVVRIGGPQPEVIGWLPNGGLAIAKWIYRVEGNVGDYVEFTVSCSNALTTDSDRVTISWTPLT